MGEGEYFFYRSKQVGVGIGQTEQSWDGLRQADGGQGPVIHCRTI